MSETRLPLRRPRTAGSPGPAGWTGPWLASAGLHGLVVGAALICGAGGTGGARSPHVAFEAPAAVVRLAPDPDPDFAPPPDVCPDELPDDVADVPPLPDPFVADLPPAPIALTSPAARFPAEPLGRRAGPHGVAGGTGRVGAAPAAPAPPVAAPVAAPATELPAPPRGESRAPRFDGAPTPPRYPDAARRRGWEGVTHLRVRVAADGSVEAVEIVSSSGRELLDAAAVEAARTWRFAPALEDGRAVEGAIDVPVRFRLDG